MNFELDKSTVIVFDLDDTLYEEITFLKSGYRKVADFIVSSHFDDPYDELLVAYTGGRNAFREVIGKYRYPFSVDRLLSVYREHSPEIKLSPGAKELLDRLKDAGYILGMITDGRSITQRNKIRALGIERYFSDILISEESGWEKPSPEPYRFFMDKYPGRKYCYIGNNPAKDFIAPNRLGWDTIGLCYQHGHIHTPPADLPGEYLPRYEINSLKDISLG